MQSVQRALTVLEHVAAHPDGLNAKRVARLLGLPLPTTYHLLRTLTHAGWLERAEGTYRIGPSALDFSSSRPRDQDSCTI
ncbi:helix-turn-helix domain-containing protein [Streptomyces sp. VRA16 Mangrove soil]|uniref:helix-turn-helix domain-containing protein n=1 Tax=Streptomyces sp. VRA16 Mangrove soil TaxID=2817434 RepID=UPI001E4BB18A|nr:helix-turn-helix domain-containing protein [Streptomyces sp. VRA16 Mangrove soil]